MANKEPGYVYILTNPSFREDWVKIGKSSRPVANTELSDNQKPSFFLHQLGAEFIAQWGGATYQGIKIADKLPSIEALQERIKLLEAQLEHSAG